MLAADVYSQHNSYNMSQQQQQQYNPLHAFRSTNKPTAMISTELMHGKTNQSHPHQTYQELVEKSISEVNRFRACNFPPPPPPRVRVQERRMAS